MASQTFDTIVHRPDRILMRTFRPVSFPAFKITQTKFLTYKNKMYCILGQKTYNSPLYTHFIVIDSYGHPVDDRSGLKVFERVSRLNIVQYIEQNQLFNIDEGVLSKKTIDKIKSVENLDVHTINELITRQKNFAHNFDDLLEEAKQLFNQSEWYEEDFKTFDRRWYRFWSGYAHRLERLLNIRNIMLQHNLLNIVADQPFHNLFKEANHMYQLFVQMIPVDRPLTKKINDLIQIQYELGKTRTSQTRKYVISTNETVLYYFFRYGFIISLFLSLWILFRFIMKKGGLIPLIAIIILAIFFFSIRIGHEVGILRMIDYRLKKLRKKQLSSTSIVKRVYQKEIEQIEQNSQEILPTFKFTGTLVKLPRSLILLGIGIVFMSLLMIMTPSPMKSGPGFTLFGVLLIVIGILLSKSKLTKRVICLKESLLKIGKHTYPIDDVIYFQVYEKHHRLKVRLRTYPDPITFRIDRKKGQAINDQIITWCQANFVRVR